MSVASSDGGDDARTLNVPVVALTTGMDPPGASFLPLQDT